MAVVDVQGGPLVELARRLVYFRGDVLIDREPNEAKVKRILYYSSATVLVGSLLAVSGLLVPADLSGLRTILPVGGMLLLGVGTLFVRSSVGQATYELASRALELISRGAGVFTALLAVVIAIYSLFLLAVNTPGASAVGSGVLALLIAGFATLISWMVTDSSRALVRADRGRSHQWDSKMRLFLMWMTLLVVVWVAMQLAVRIEEASGFVGLVEVVVILAAPLVFAYVNHRSDVRKRLVLLAGLFGETEAAAEATVRKNASADARAHLRAQLMKLQTHLHTDRVVKLAGFRTRGLIDTELVILIDRVSLMVGKVAPPPGAEFDSSRVNWLDDELIAHANPPNLAALANELRRRALAAVRQY